MCFKRVFALNKTKRSSFLWWCPNPWVFILQNLFPTVLVLFFSHCFGLYLMVILTNSHSEDTLADANAHFCFQIYHSNWVLKAQQFSELKCGLMSCSLFHRHREWCLWSKVVILKSFCSFAVFAQVWLALFSTSNLFCACVFLPLPFLLFLQFKMFSLNFEIFQIHVQLCRHCSETFLSQIFEINMFHKTNELHCHHARERDI